MKYLEENFISIVLVVTNDENIVLKKVASLFSLLKNNFKNYELIVVDNKSTDGTRKILQKNSDKITLIELFKKHNGQQALAAGIDIAVGDYIVEIEDCSIEVDYAVIMDMYKESQKGNDFVFCTPKNTNFQSKLFYKLINKHFNQTFRAELSSTIITLSSRRGQNKTAETGSKIVNRNISYVLSGLNCSEILIDINYGNRRGFIANVNLMLDTLIYYTDLITSFAVFVAIMCMLVSIFAGIYSVITYFTITTAPGWASTIVMGSAAFSGVFFMFAIISKYLYHIIHNTSHAKDYIFNSITKK